MMERSSSRTSIVFCMTNSRATIGRPCNNNKNKTNRGSNSRSSNSCSFVSLLWIVASYSILLTVIQLLQPLSNSYHHSNTIHFLLVTGFSGRRRIIRNNSQHRYRHRYTFLSSSSSSSSATALPVPASTHNKLQVLSSSIYLADDNNNNAGVFSGDDDTNEDDEEVMVNLIELLGTCVKAAQLGCHEIRRVHKQLQRDSRSSSSSSSSTDDGTDKDIGRNATTIDTVDYKILDDPRSALTAADIAAQLVIVDWIDTMYPGIHVIGEEDLVCDIDDDEIPLSDATGGSICASTDIFIKDDDDDNANDDVAIENLKKELYASLKNNRNSNTKDNNILKIPMEDITLFVDPLDGTREFVEGRVYNVQCLIGIAVNGYSVGGAVGLPFPMIDDNNTDNTDDESGSSNSSSSSSSSSNSSHEEEAASSSPDSDSDTDVAIVCALEGTGPPRVVQREHTNAVMMTHRRRRTDPSNPIHGGGVPSDGPRPLLVSGDVRNDAVLEAAYTVALLNTDHNADGDYNDSSSIGNTDGGRSLLLGGTGQKCLAVAEHRADIAIMNFLSSSWDTCAPEALVRASGGYVTDIFGERIIHAKYPQVPLPPISASSQNQNQYLNTCGVIASSKEYRNNHNAICAAMKQNHDALSRCLIPWGLVISTENDNDTNNDDNKEQSTDDVVPTNEEVECILQNRRETQLKGV